jgi:hypothetical protein
MRLHYIALSLLLLSPISLFAKHHSSSESHEKKRKEIKTPIIEQLKPVKGYDEKKIIIKGKHLITANHVFFGEEKAHWFRILSDRRIEAIVPYNGDIPGEVEVRVEAGDKTSDSLPFTYVPSKILPPIIKKAEQVKNQFLLQQEYAHAVDVSYPHKGLHPIAYYVYSDPALEDLLAKIRLGDHVKHGFTIHMHQVVKNKPYTYYIVAEGTHDRFSDVSIVNIN